MLRRGPIYLHGRCAHPSICFPLASGWKAADGKKGQFKKPRHKFNALAQFIANATGRVVIVTDCYSGPYVQDKKTRTCTTGCVIVSRAGDSSNPVLKNDREKALQELVVLFQWLQGIKSKWGEQFSVDTRDATMNTDVGSGGKPQFYFMDVSGVDIHPTFKECINKFWKPDYDDNKTSSGSRALESPTTPVDGFFSKRTHLSCQPNADKKDAEKFEKWLRVSMCLFDDVSVVEDMNVPLYCTCNKAEYGTMICCDDETCIIEWFHMNCVRLAAAPHGVWYCPSCTDKRNGTQTVITSPTPVNKQPTLLVPKRQDIQIHNAICRLYSAEESRHWFYLPWERRRGVTRIPHKSPLSESKFPPAGPVGMGEGGTGAGTQSTGAGTQSMTPEASHHDQWPRWFEVGTIKTWSSRSYPDWFLNTMFHMRNPVRNVIKMHGPKLYTGLPGSARFRLSAGNRLTVNFVGKDPENLEKGIYSGSPSGPRLLKPKLQHLDDMPYHTFDVKEPISEMEEGRLLDESKKRQEKVDLQVEELVLETKAAYQELCKAFDDATTEVAKYDATLDSCGVDAETKDSDALKILAKNKLGKVNTLVKTTADLVSNLSNSSPHSTVVKVKSEPEVNVGQLCERIRLCITILDSRQSKLSARLQEHTSPVDGTSDPSAGTSPTSENIAVSQTVEEKHWSLRLRRFAQRHGGGRGPRLIPITINDLPWLRKNLGETGTPMYTRNSSLDMQLLRAHVEIDRRTSRTNTPINVTFPLSGGRWVLSIDTGVNTPATMTCINTGQVFFVCRRAGREIMKKREEIRNLDRIEAEFKNGMNEDEKALLPVITKEKLKLRRRIKKLQKKIHKVTAMMAASIPPHGVVCFPENLTNVKNLSGMSRHQKGNIQALAFGSMRNTIKMYCRRNGELFAFLKIL